MASVKLEAQCGRSVIVMDILEVKDLTVKVEGKPIMTTRARTALPFHQQKTRREKVIG
jgi:hypothetical protein